LRVRTVPRDVSTALGRQTKLYRPAPVEHGPSKRILRRPANIAIA
jgi:hypothetical protein